jgi:hypothetical protein
MRLEVILEEKKDKNLTMTIYGRPIGDWNDPTGPLLDFDIDEWELVGPDGDIWRSEHFDFEEVISFSEVVDLAEHKRTFNASEEFHYE